MKRPLIKWGKEDKTLDTQYGRISYLEFCKNEKKRIRRNTKVLQKDGECCLMD